MFETHASAEVLPPLPRRVAQAGDISPDDSAAIFNLLREGSDAGLRVALLTLVDTIGGSARGPGAQMAVLEDGRFAGYLSSGCVESAIATEAIGLMRQGRNAVLRFGVGSPFLDIRLSCGGSIDVLVDVHVNYQMIATAIAHLTARKAFSIAFDPAGPALLDTDLARRTGWHDSIFRRAYQPATRLVVLGRGLEVEAVAKLGAAAGYAVAAYAADDQNVERLGASGIACERLSTPRTPPDLGLDPYTALVLLFHDHEWEEEILHRALAADCLYIGALGSALTHRRRCETLRARGHADASIDRIRGPIGLFGPTRDASSLAISVLAELAQLTALDRG